MSEYRYFLKRNGEKEFTEVSQERFILEEACAGFYSIRNGETATGGFSTKNVTGKMVPKRKSIKRTERYSDYEKNLKRSLF